MSLKTIVVHVDSTPRCSTRIGVAAQLALKYDAHLIGVAPAGWPPLLYAPAAGGLPMVAVGNPADPTPTYQAKAALAAFEAQARALGLASIESRLVEEEDGMALALHGRCSDLIVLGQSGGPDAAPAQRPDFPQWVMLHGPTPVLVVPAQGDVQAVGARVAVAWNGSNEARRAIGSALPLLRSADKVHLFIFSAGGNVIGMDEPPGADMGLYLARHGVNAEIDVDTTSPDAGQALIGATAECGADLLVMGAYGRSRLREMLMGGASRTMLSSMRVPVWMAH